MPRKTTSTNDKSTKAGTKAAGSRNGTNASNATRRKKILGRDSRIHGRGVYAARRILEGERIIEYRGERITWREADRRPPSDPDDPHHTFLFSLDDGRHVIDANVGGNSARWINHSCQPNCETEETDDGRVYIQALRDIRRGEELSYDYCLVIDERLTPTLKRQYQCRCGTPNCRGTMLAVKRRNGAG
jgi:SET domain-containing protein